MPSRPRRPARPTMSSIASSIATGPSTGSGARPRRSTIRMAGSNVWPAWPSASPKGNACSRNSRGCRAERTLRESLLRTIFDNAPIGIAVITAEGKYLMANGTYESVPGHRVTLVGHQLGEFSPPRTAAFMRQVLEHVVRTGERFSVREFEASVGPGREQTWWNNDVVPLVGVDGKVEAVLVLTQEVTQEVLTRHRADKALANGAISSPAFWRPRAHWSSSSTVRAGLPSSTAGSRASHRLQLRGDQGAGLL